MLRRNVRLRREYLYRKNLEGKERLLYEKKRKIKQALEEGKSIPTELRNEDAALRQEIDLQDERTAGRAGVPIEVMGLMLGEFVDEYTVRVVDVFAMPQSGTGQSTPPSLELRKERFFRKLGSSCAAEVSFSCAAEYPQLDSRRCSQLITKLLYLLNQGDTFTKLDVANSSLDHNNAWKHPVVLWW